MNTVKMNYGTGTLEVSMDLINVARGEATRARKAGENMVDGVAVLVNPLTPNGANFMVGSMIRLGMKEEEARASLAAQPNKQAAAKWLPVQFVTLLLAEISDVDKEMLNGLTEPPPPGHIRVLFITEMMASCTVLLPN